MPRSLLFAVLVGCTTSPSLSTKQSPPPTRPITLVGPSTAGPGDTVTVQATLPSGAPAVAQNGYNVFFPSTTGGFGTGFCGGPLGSSCLDILGSINLLGPAQTASGTATLSYTIPAGFADPALYLQGVVISPAGTAFLSNAIEIVVEEEPVDTDVGPSVCGDNVVEGAEACDDGVNLGLNLGDCVPGCLGEVQHVLSLTLSSETYPSDFAAGASEFSQAADAACKEGFQAVISDGVSRVASVTPFRGDGQQDWPIEPFTAYYDAETGDHMWTTDDVALLGIRDGAASTLSTAGPVRPTYLTTGRAWWSGVGMGWTTAETCNGWTTTNAASSGTIGNTTHTSSRNWSAGDNDCGSFERHLVCAEPVERCGNGVVDPGEVCDSGVAVNGRAFCGELLHEENGCYTDSTGRVACSLYRGTPYYVELHDGPYQTVRSTGASVCSITVDGELSCDWFLGNYPSSMDPDFDPSKSYVDIALGSDYVYNTSCAVATDGTIECWGRNVNFQDRPPASGPGGYYFWREVSMGSQSGCGLAGFSTVSRADAATRPSEVFCWGNVATLGASRPTVPVRDLDIARDVVGCALDEDGYAHCFWDSFGEVPLTPPDAVFEEIAVGTEFTTVHACGIDCNGSLVCWGEMTQTMQDAIDAYDGYRFRDLDPQAACAIAVDSYPGDGVRAAHTAGDVVCWKGSQAVFAESFCETTPPSVAFPGDLDCDLAPTAQDCDDQDPYLGLFSFDEDCDGVLLDVDCDDGDDTVAASWVGHCDDCPDVYGSNHAPGAAFTPLFSPSVGFSADIEGGLTCLSSPRDFYALTLGANNPVETRLTWTDPDATFTLTALEQTPSTIFGAPPVWSTLATGTCDTTTRTCDLTYTPGLNGAVVRVQLETPSATDSDGDGSFEAVEYTLSWGDLP